MAEKAPTYDLIIIGAGPAGLAAAIYASRRKLKTLVIAKNIGGQMTWATTVENYPGFETISGFDLANHMKKQSEKWQTEYDFSEVTGVQKNKEIFSVQTKNKNYEARAVILAFGLTPKDLNVPGEERLKGHGATYCATCDGPLYKGKIVAVAGGGSSGLEAAIYLSTLAKKVYLIHFSRIFSAAPYLLDRAKHLTNVEFYCCSKIKEIKGDKKVASVVLVDSHDQSRTEEIKIDGLFIEIGYHSQTDWLKGIVALNDTGEIKINRDTETSVPGIFAAGDCSDNEYKQIVVAAGEGAKAALQAYKYLVMKKDSPLPSDWGHCERVKTHKKESIEISAK